MMNYIVLNGIKSTTIRGLLISTLPPFVKPLIRTQIDQIDGRDGDIVTKLGYASYNKQIGIGLHGDYDIDDVIDFFNSEGKVIFSNEPDKYYNYQIIDEIDFEKLLRFKKATITLHIQPFKYSAVGTKVSLDVSNRNSINLLNRGNIYSRPTITLYGTGTINLFINSKLVLTINLGDQEYITIDTNEMNAYKGDTLLNRLVIGNYDDVILKVGENTISWLGSVSKIEVENYSRWI